MWAQFAVGDIYVNPIAGNEAPNPTAVQAIGVQNINLELSQTLKELKGPFKGPDDVAPAEMKLTGKLVIGRVDVDLFNQAFFAETPATNAPIVAAGSGFGEGPNAVPVSPFQITVSHSANFVKDLGVRNSATLQPFTRVSGTPTAGQYSVSSGVYTFSSADHTSAVSVYISYLYSSTAGNLLTVHNQLMGFGPVFEMYLWEPYASTLNLSTNNGFHIYAARFSKLNVPLKRDDFAYPELDFEAYPNASQQWFDIIDGSGF